MTLKKVSKVKVLPKERDSVYLAQQNEKSRKEQERKVKGNE